MEMNCMQMEEKTQMRWDDEVKLDLKVMKIYHWKKQAESGN
jgi:hypothetical protein